MGIDAVMGVALNKTNVAEINGRFRQTHEKEDSLLYGEDIDLIGGLLSRDIEGVEYVNAYRVNTGLSRYYGIGYERGPALKIITQLEWLRAQPEVIEVYYAGDTSDDLRVWNEQDSRELLWHFFKFGHSPYAKWALGTWKADEK